MDEVLEKFETNFRTQDEASGTNFEGLYKNWGKLNNQEQRRKDILSVQRVKRNDLLDKFRGVVELVEAVEGSNIFQEEKHLYKPQIFVAGFTKTAYSNVLMLSEWMIEKPEDFNDKWLVVPCPVGVRTLVIASQGRTKCYSKYGHFTLDCDTALPGGRRGNGNENRCCVLDCFYVESLKTMFVLDLLAWNNIPMCDGETDFRHYWLQTQLLEILELRKLSKRNQFIFKILPKVSCAKESFDEFMMTIPHFKNYVPKLDGLLFYHKKAHYFAGQTPLVGWLYPFMVPEVIGPDVKINPAYMVDKPNDYVSQADYIMKFEKRTAFKRELRKKSRFSMDTTPPSQTDDTVLPPPQICIEFIRKTVQMDADTPKDTPETESERKSQEDTVQMEADLPKYTPKTESEEKPQEME